MDDSSNALESRIHILVTTEVTDMVGNIWLRVDGFSNIKDGDGRVVFAKPNLFLNMTAQEAVTTNDKIRMRHQNREKGRGCIALRYKMLKVNVLIRTRRLRNPSLKTTE